MAGGNFGANRYADLARNARHQPFPAAAGNRCGRIRSLTKAR
jgi:hypothetical protein